MSLKPFTPSDLEAVQRMAECNGGFASLEVIETGHAVVTYNDGVKEHWRNYAGAIESSLE